MGLEDVPIQVLRREDGEWVPHASAKSGYHGSFAVRLAPGRYTLRAHALLEIAGKPRVELAGELSDLEVPAGVKRVDRLLIRLAPGSSP